MAGRPLNRTKSLRSWLIALAAGLLGLTARADSGSAVLDQWLAAQTNLHTWSADAIQTRSLQTFSQPLVSTGKVWVVPPDQFRWEVRRPAPTIAVRQPDKLFLIYPRLKRVEQYPLGGKRPGPWKDALALLEASFPRSRADLEDHFRVLSVAQTNALVQLVLQPRSPSARKFIGEVRVGVRTNDFSPASTELRFSDGSSIRNDFTNSVVNAPLPPDLFEVRVDPGFTLVEPAGP